MSETASNPRNVHSLAVPDPTQAEIPPQLWLRSGRPLVGTATRVYIAVALIATALIFMPRGPAFWGVIAGGVLSYFLFPLVIQGLLAPLERRVLAARRSEATALLQEVRARRLVRQFAPHAWLTLQEGRLHLRRGDGKAAARAFTETVRLSRGADAPALISAQAQALLIADQPEQTRELLQALGKRQALSPADQLHLGLALLASKGHAREALAHVQAAEAGLGPRPRVLAALALALHRGDQTTAALAALQQAQEALGSEPDPFDEGLIQRAVKLLRPVQKAQQKRERKQGEAAAPVARVAAVEPGTTTTTAPAKVGANAAAEAKAKSARKIKKEERRASRRAAKAEKRTQGPELGKGKKPGRSDAKLVVAKETRPAAAQQVAAKQVVKPVEAAVAKPVTEAKPVEPTTVKPVGEAKPVGEPTIVRPVGEAKPAGEQAIVKPVEPTIVKPVEVEPAGELPIVEPVEAKAAGESVKPVEAKPAGEQTKPVVEVKPVDAVAARSSGLQDAPTKPAVDPARVSAPPAGASLFGSLGASGAPRPPIGAPRVPSTPLRPGGAPPTAGPPRAPVAPSASGPVPAAMSSGTAAPVPATMSTAPPVITPGAPLRLPSMPTPPAVRPPSAPVASVLVPAAAMPAAPRVVLPSPPVSAPVLPPRPAAPVVQPRPAGAVVLPSAPLAAAAPLPAPTTGPALAQVLPDTDDGWDDMLDALEADGPSSPV